MRCGELCIMILCFFFSHFKIENYVNKRRKNEELKTYCVMMIHTQWSGMLSCYTVNSNQRRHLFRIQTQIQCQQNVGLVCLWISFCFCDVYIRLRDFIHSARELVAIFCFVCKCLATRQRNVNKATQANWWTHANPNGNGKCVVIVAKQKWFCFGQK